MSKITKTKYQLRAAAKAFEWLGAGSKPAVAAREQEKDERRYLVAAQ